MGKVKNTRKRLLTLVLALAMVLTSVSVPSTTAEAAKKVKVKKIQITSPKKKTVTLVKGKTLQIKVKVTPKNAKNKKVSYKSSNKKIASVSSKGKVKGVKKGTAKITVTAKDGSKKKATLTVKVTNPVKVKKVALNKKTATVNVGKTVTLKATVTPKNATNKAVSWKTSSKGIATVTSKGVVKGVKAGTATITATAKDGSKKKATCKVTVKKPSTPTPPPAKKTLDSIAITKAPTKTEYFVGDKFDPAGMEVTAAYSDKSKKVLDAKDYTFTPAATASLRVTDKKVTVSYTEGGVTKTAETAISVKIKPTVQSIAVTTMPTKTTYVEDETFDPAGMVVTATLSDKTTKEITDYTYVKEPLKVTAGAEHSSFVISYKVSSNKELKVEVPITVTAKIPLKSISVELLKTTLERAGGCFQEGDIAVKATFEDNSTKDINVADCIVNPAEFTKETNSAEVSYWYGGKKESATVSGFKVTTYRERYTFEDAQTVGTIVKRANESTNNIPTSDNASGITPEFVAGLQGKALKMDGTYGLRLDKIAGTASESYSISMWVKPEEFKTSQALVITTSSEFGFNSNPDGETWCAVADANSNGTLKLWSRDKDKVYPGSNGWITVAGSPVIAKDKWSHVVLVVDGTTTAAGTAPAEGSSFCLGTLYVNGKKVASGDVFNEKANDRGKKMKTYFGTTAWKDDGYYKGLVDEFVFTHEALTESDVETYYLENAKATGQISEITKVSPDDGTEIEVDYGTPLVDVKRELEDIPFKAAAAGEDEEISLSTKNMWTVENYDTTSTGNVTATVKLQAPEGYLFKQGEGLSLTMTRTVKVKIKTPVTISAVTPSKAAVTVPFGADEAAIKAELAKLTFTVTTSDSSPYEITNAAAKWTLTEDGNGYKAAFDLGKPETGYKYADNLKVEVTVTEQAAVKITGLTVAPATLEVAYGTTETAVKTELAKGTISAAVASGGAPAISNTAELWTIKNYAAQTAGEYTAEATIAAPVGYAFNEGVSNKVTVQVTVLAKGGHTLSGIEVTTAPARTKYIVGDDFDKTGMVITASYADGEKEDVTAKAEVEAATNLALDKKTITITYTEGEISKEYILPIIVNKVEDGAAAYYTFDGTLANAKDASNVGKTVKSITNGFEDTTVKDEDLYAENGINGKCLNVNQTTAADLQQSIAAANKNFTISLWAKVGKESTNWATVLQGQNPDADSQYGKGLVFYVNPDGQKGKMELQVSNKGGGNAGETKSKRLDLPASEWVMLTFVNNTDGAAFYINDGESKLTDAEKNDFIVTKGLKRLIAGAGQWNANDFLVGGIDEVRIYNSSLSAKQVEDLYKLVKPTISGISVDAKAEDFTFSKADLNNSTDKIQEALKALTINVTMKNGTAPVFENTADWTITPEYTGEAGSYTATKELAVSNDYALAKGVSKTLTVNVIVKEIELSSIAVTTPPNKLYYKPGEEFDATGMVVTALYNDNKTTKDVTKDVVITNKAVVSPDDATAASGEQTITISYTEGEVTKTAEYKIKVVNPDTPMGAVLAARIAYYTFDETLADSVKGNTVAKSVANQSLTETNITDRYDSTGKKGACLKVNKNAGGVLIPDTIAAEQKEFTINLWVKKTSESTKYGTIMQGFNSSQYGKGLVFYANIPDDQTKVQLEANGGNAKQFAHMNDQWTMMTFVNKADTTEFYINGVKQTMTDEEAKKYIVTKGISRITLGAGQWNASEYLVGGIDEVSLYNAALTADQITLLKQEVEATQAPTE